jgi:signal transduction histidine kinase
MRFRGQDGKCSGSGHLLALASHDLKNPASGVLTASQFLIEDAAHRLEPEQLAVLNSIEESARQMISLIDDLAEISAIESNRFRLSTQPRDLGRIIRGILAQQQTAAAFKALRVDLESDPGMPRVPVEPVRISRAIQRLLSLSISSAPVGSGIRIRLGRAAHTAVISVETTTPAGVALKGEGGASLGMALVERITAAHGGVLEPGSGPAGGSGYVLKLPLSRRVRSSSHHA